MGGGLTQKVRNDAFIRLVQTACWPGNQLASPPLSFYFDVFSRLVASRVRACKKRRSGNSSGADSGARPGQSVKATRSPRVCHTGGGWCHEPST